MGYDLCVRGIDTSQADVGSSCFFTLPGANSDRPVDFFRILRVAYVSTLPKRSSLTAGDSGLRRRGSAGDMAGSAGSPWSTAGSAESPWSTAGSAGSPGSTAGLPDHQGPRRSPPDHPDSLPSPTRRSPPSWWLATPLLSTS